MGIMDKDDMPKEAFGGDDSGGSAAARKKPKLDRFGLEPDTNIRDQFWRIMASYSTTKKPGEDLSALTEERFTLMRMSLSTLSNPASANYGPAPKFIALFSAMMFLDAGWKDAFMEFLEEGSEAKPEVMKEISSAIRKMMQHEGYRGAIGESFTAMLRARETSSIALAYIAAVESEELSRALKKELVIFARGDIGENQQNAIKAITLIKDDQEVKKSLIVLLSHWDAEARLASARALEGMKDDPDVMAAAARRRGSETDQQVKKILERIS
jgi:hypothetical protein